MPDYSKYFEANKELWNKRTAIHKDSSFYNLEGFKTGENVLTPIELNEIGDVKEKRCSTCNVISGWIAWVGPDWEPM
ncbi:MAG TPA: hypothetical protein VFD56_02370 [Chitinophagaceae bacterium]|nr:hypothetical protein [Chitinophagaceae bacterium]